MVGLLEKRLSEHWIFVEMRYASRSTNRSGIFTQRHRFMNHNNNPMSLITGHIHVLHIMLEDVREALANLPNLSMTLDAYS